MTIVDKQRTRSLMEKGLSRLQRQGFLLPEPTRKSLELRQKAVEFVARLPRRNDVCAIVLTGSAVVGNSGKGSDIDLCVIVKGTASPLRKHDFDGIVADVQEVEESNFLRDYSSGENAKYLTHIVCLYDPTGVFRRLQRKMLRAYYSEKEMAKETERVKNTVEEQTRLGLNLMRQGYLCEAAIPLDSCFFEAASLLIRRQHGVASINLLLDEVFRIGKALGRPHWEKCAIRCLRLDCSPHAYRQLIVNHDRMLSLMRRKLNKNVSLVRRMKRLKFKGPLSLCNILETICAETGAQQVRDKVERALAAKRPHQAGLCFLYESSCDFFIFSPFFYLKNANPYASAIEICRQSVPDLLKYWDGDAREEWKAIMRADRLTRSRLVELDNLNGEILSPFCASDLQRKRKPSLHRREVGGGDQRTG